MDWIAPALTSGLGNRLFQYAAARGLAERLERPVVFLMKKCKESPHGPIASLFRMYPGVELIESEEPFTELMETPMQHYNYTDIVSPGGPIVIHGYRQSPKYFPKDLSVLQPDWDSALGGAAVRRLIEKEAQLSTPELRKRTISVHMRMGDYLVLPHHQIDLGRYLMNALQHVPANSRIHFFSDEPEKCGLYVRSYAASRRLDFTIALVRSDVESLYEMSLCQGGNITANSTFSWWGAWFAHQAGSPWATYPSSFGRGMPPPQDLFPEWATVIPVHSG
jgi:hypothetical protein